MWSPRSWTACLCRDRIEPSVPTRTGWWVLIVSAVAGVFGRLIGGIEFIVPAAAGLISIALALLWRRLSPVKLSVGKRLSPLRVAVGDSARVDLELRNVGTRRTPVLHLHDAVRGTRGFGVEVAPIPPNGEVHASYRLSTASRGLQEIGPVTIQDGDAFGLVRRDQQIPGVLRLVVHPRIEVVGSPPLRASEDSLLAKQRHQSPGLSDEDFDGLRPYTPGDDLRHVHWLSSARQDELQVRQRRPPRHGMLSFVIDTRPPGDLEASLDVTTSIAGSIAASVLGAGDATLIETTDGRSTSRVIGSSQLNPLLEFLALLAEGSPKIHAAVPSANGSVVAVSADPLLVTDQPARSDFAQRLGARLVITADVENWGAGHPPAHATGWIHLTGPDQLGKLFAPEHRRPYEFI